MAPVVQKMDNAIQRKTQLVSPILIRWMVIYEVISGIQRLNNQPFVFIVVTLCLCYFITGSPRF